MVNLLLLKDMLHHMMKTTKVIKFFQDRSQNYHPTEFNQQDYVGVSSEGRRFNFDSDGPKIFTVMDSLEK